MSDAEAYGSAGVRLHDIAFDWRLHKEADFLQSCVSGSQEEPGPLP